jgi:hypothetical protein
VREFHGDFRYTIVTAVNRRLTAAAAGSFAADLGLANHEFLDPVTGFSAALSQRDCFPRPDQVSEGSSGFRYFGNTRGYFRRSRGAPCGLSGSDWRISFSRRSWANRFSSSRFSDANRTDNTLTKLFMELPQLIYRHSIEIWFLVHPVATITIPDGL